MKDEAERIAAGLTANERANVLKAYDSGMMRRGTARGMWGHGILQRGLDAIWLNETGLEVRKLLQEQSHAD